VLLVGLDRVMERARVMKMRFKQDWIVSVGIKLFDVEFMKTLCYNPFLLL
jgi:hypothetical protein